MLSVQQCRKILGVNCSLTDSEVEELRHQLYGLADIALTTSHDQLWTRNASDSWNQEER